MVKKKDVDNDHTTCCRLLKFVTLNSGIWLPLQWPPEYGIVFGNEDYFLGGCSLKKYKRFTCLCPVERIVFLGIVCKRGARINPGTDPEIIIDRSGLYCYINSEDRLYLIADSVMELRRYGLVWIYSFYEYDLSDDLEKAWYPMSIAKIFNNQYDLKDWYDVLQLSRKHDGSSFFIGGSILQTFTFSTDVFCKRAGYRLFEKLERYGLYLIGFIPSVGIIAINKNCFVFLLTRSMQIIELSGSVRAFFRGGSLYFKLRTKSRLSPICALDSPNATCRSFYNAL